MLNLFQHLIDPETILNQVQDRVRDDNFESFDFRKVKCYNNPNTLRRTIHAKNINDSVDLVKDAVDIRNIRYYNILY